MHPEILKRLSKIPTSIYVADKSTPVISFGNFEKAKIGTLGINPSPKEFFNRDNLLAPDKKRLIDLESLNLQSYEQITENNIDNLKDIIAEDMSRNFPGITVNSLDVYGTEDLNTLQVVLNYSIINFGIQDTLQLNL